MLVGKSMTRTKSKRRNQRRCLLKTVTVRIAVAINRDGTYRAFGSSDAKDGAMKFAVRPFRKRTGQTIIIEHEVPLPIPEPVEVQGKAG